MSTETTRFDTPEPITLHLRNQRGSVRLLASDRADTVVEVTGPDDVVATVTCSDDGRMVSVTAPTHPGSGSVALKVLGRTFGWAPHLDIVVQLPAGSNVDLGTGSAPVEAAGQMGRVRARSASGEVTIERVLGDAEVSTASGEIRLGQVDGATVLKSASGDLAIACGEGPISAATASGEITVGRAERDLAAKSASGALTVREVSHGEVTMSSTSGHVSVGVRGGTLVWLDLVTVSGHTASDLTPDDPGEAVGDAAVRIRARTVSGNITVGRSTSVGAPA